ncbi:Arv1-like family protein [Metarhizium robertsii ARSEF 23]|uniref:Protein ARV n=1 Tax=Metarhizium robertsii (strain ARSEF 23 / ATCC MYA-3075) TaxID=655844 RepID=E9EPG0_METRA|nr:Arv1-like family protein [Metarhizium robertsii ARSEF 23]EFZ02430.2 Arv1-like family protein [Metarhizium robertsii ARSEF 23]
MPICIECRHPVKTLWTKYSGAGDQSSGHNIRLSVCRNCGFFCDKYVEHDFVVIFIDLVLIKPQVTMALGACTVCRVEEEPSWHLLHNTLMRNGDRFDVCTTNCLSHWPCIHETILSPSPCWHSWRANADTEHVLTNTPAFHSEQPSIIRLGILLLLFDVYLTWERIEKRAGPAMFPGGGNLGNLAQQPITVQYLFFLVLCTLSTLAFHLIIRFLTCSSYSPFDILGIMPRYARPNSVSTALLLSSYTKLFPILMVIWKYDIPAAARPLGWAVVANNIEALRILLDCKYYTACILALAGATSRWAAGRFILIAAGLGDVDSISESSVAADGRALWALFLLIRDWAGRLAVG